MKLPMPNPDGAAVIEVESRIAICVVLGCEGTIVRHSLGAGQSVDRCTRCFRRYQVRPVAAAESRGRLRRLVDEFITWRE